MAAYAALVSVMNLIDQLQLHPYPPISLHQKQVESFTEKVTFLQEFLESYSHVGYSDEAVDLESRIADAAHEAEDVIESHITDQILRGSTSHAKKINSIEFYNGLQKVIEDFDSIKTEVMEIKEKMDGVQNQLHRNSSSISVGSTRSPLAWQNKTMVGLDDVLTEMMDKLTGGQLELQIIPIVGMGGIGKTTLAKNIYENRVVVEHFDILAWATISQEYKMREILVALLGEGRDGLSEMDESKLGEKLHKKLSSRRYLIIMDDIWDVKVWERIKFYFPDYKNGSRIMLTSRLSNLALEITDCHGLKMKLLDDDASWNLFCENVFGKEDCPLELEGIGKSIARNCKGLPLSIVVIGGLLTKSEKTREYWEDISENLNSIVNLENDGHCLEILYMSYNNLPVYLKPCFLYLGSFEEDDDIYVSKLIKFWVAEGFLKPIVGKSLEEAGEQYLKELIDRNLILHPKCNSCGKIKSLVVHDLIRDLCLKEAQKQKFFCVVRDPSLSIPQGINTGRRIFIYEESKNDDDESENHDDESENHDDESEKNDNGKSETNDNDDESEKNDDDNDKPEEGDDYDESKKNDDQDESEKYEESLRAGKSSHGDKSEDNDDESVNNNVLLDEDDESPPQVPQAQTLRVLQSESLVRVLMWECEDQILLPFSFRLLRIAAVSANSLESVFQQVNLRCLFVDADHQPLSGFPSSMCLLWNLQTLIIHWSDDVIAPSEIWKMPLLRHVQVKGLYLPDPPSDHTDGQADIILKNLQTLSEICNFKCSEEVVKRIPNIKKLKICYNEALEDANYCHNNLVHLDKLESFHCYYYPLEILSHPMQNLTFSHSLKKLSLWGTHLHWNIMTTTIGFLPLLQVLKLRWDSFTGRKWETIEGQFCSLKFLLIQNCYLKYWMTTDSTHFPCLEHLVLQGLSEFEEIPSSIGDIPTLQSIEIAGCRGSAVSSAKRIREEQEELGNVELKVQINGL